MADMEKFNDDLIIINLYSASIFRRTHVMAIPVVEFSREGYKIRKLFG